MPMRTSLRPSDQGLGNTETFVLNLRKEKRYQVVGDLEADLAEALR